VDAAKKIVGRKRSIVTDTLGLLLAVLVTAASVQDSDAGRTLVEHAATLGINMEIVQRTSGIRGFAPLPKRWTVERTYGWLMLHRRLARDYETPPAQKP
jgi:transposase